MSMLFDILRFVRGGVGPATRWVSSQCEHWFAFSLSLALLHKVNALMDLPASHHGGTIVNDNS